jgi:hypothetical protein
MLLLILASMTRAQSGDVIAFPRAQVVVRSAQVDKVTVFQVAPHFATAIRIYEPVNSVPVGEPGQLRCRTLRA